MSREIVDSLTFMLARPCQQIGMFEAVALPWLVDLRIDADTDRPPGHFAAHGRIVRRGKPGATDGVAGHRVRAEQPIAMACAGQRDFP